MKRLNGFTLIELLIVLAIIGILSAVAIIGILSAVAIPKFVDLAKHRHCQYIVEQNGHTEVFDDCYPSGSLQYHCQSKDGKFGIFVGTFAIKRVEK